MRSRLLETFVTSAVALLIAGCGGSDAEDTAATSTPAGTPTATATATATATPTPTATTTATVSATATATSTATGEGTGGTEAGDEEGIAVPVDLTVSEDRIRASTDRVAAFLPLRFTVRSELRQEVQVVVVRSGEGGGPAGRVTLPAGQTATVDLDGLPPGSLEVLSPDLDPDMTAIVQVVRGG
jgi:hypothetical protein